MNVKELRALLAVQGKSLVVVWKKIKYYRFQNPALGKKHFDRKSIIVKTGWLAYTVPLAKKPKRQPSVEDDILYIHLPLKAHRGDAVKHFAKRWVQGFARD